MLDNVSRFRGSFSRLTSSRSSRSRFSLLSSRNSRTISSLIPSSLSCSASGRAAAFSVPSPLLFRFFSFVLTQFLPQTHPHPLSPCTRRSSTILSTNRLSLLLQTPFPVLSRRIPSLFFNPVWFARACLRLRSNLFSSPSSSPFSTRQSRFIPAHPLFIFLIRTSSLLLRLVVSLLTFSATVSPLNPGGPPLLVHRLLKTLPPAAPFITKNEREGKR